MTPDTVKLRSDKHAVLDGMKRELAKAIDKNLPVYIAERYTPTKIRFFCPWCKRFHGHGEREIVPMKLYHRVAHCTSMAGHLAHPDGYMWFVLKPGYKMPHFS